jgi:hypothetical protein
MSVLVTAACGVGVFFIAVGIASDSYRSAHQLARVETGWWIFTTYEPAPVSFEQLGISTVVTFAALAAMYAIVLHPLMGRFVEAVARFLTRHIVSVYRLDAGMSEWSPDVSVVFGSAWPITIVSVPFLFIGLIVGLVYRTLWQWR